jgi:hypothetical protein
MQKAVLGVGALYRALLSGLSNPPSVAAVTTSIVAVQTIIGLLGFWVAGTEVKSIIKGSTKRHAIAAIWSIFLHSEIRGHSDPGVDPEEGRPPQDDAQLHRATTNSCADYTTGRSQTFCGCRIERTPC